MTVGLVAVAFLLLLSVAASKLSTRFGVPGLLLFIAIGMLAGSEGPGNIYFADFGVAQSVGTVALAFILFAGGLDTSFAEIRPVLRSGLSLATVGTGVSTAIVAFAGHYLLGVTPLEGFLLGAIVSSTDAPAVFGVLRTQSLNLRPRLRAIIELESGSNDPMAVFLTVAALQLMSGKATSFPMLAVELVVEMVVGAVGGYVIGRTATWLINRLRLDADGLYPVLTIAVVLLCFGGVSLLHGNGFLAVYVAGLTIGNRRFLHRRTLIHFHDGLSWLMQIVMFLTLGLLVFPSRLVPVAGSSFVIAIVLVFLARPLSVFAALAASGYDWREKMMIAWAGLRGAVPIVLATFPALERVPNSQVIFDVVFFVVLTSVLVQGLTIAPFARKLGVLESDSDHEHPVRRSSELVTIEIVPGAQADGQAIVQLDIPPQNTVLLLYRDNGFSTPNGATVLRGNDRIIMLASKETIAETRHIFEQPV